jgi:hypothetical protein
VLPVAKMDLVLNPIDITVRETEIILQPIYFEFDKSNITREVAFELGKFIKVFKNSDTC